MNYHKHFLFGFIPIGGYYVGEGYRNDIRLWFRWAITIRHYESVPKEETE